MSKERYSQIVDKVYTNYLIEDARILHNMSVEALIEYGYRLSKSQFIDKIKHDLEFSRKWDLKIIEDYDLISNTESWNDVTVTRPVRRNKLTIVHGTEIFVIYE